MAKYRDILGNESEIEDKTITISLEKYNTLIIKEAIADGLIQAKNKEKKLVQDTDELLEMYNDVVKDLEKFKEYVKIIDNQPQAQILEDKITAIRQIRYSDNDCMNAAVQTIVIDELVDMWEKLQKQWSPLP